jgi:serine protease Do
MADAPASALLASARRQWHVRSFMTARIPVILLTLAAAAGLPAGARVARAQFGGPWANGPISFAPLVAQVAPQVVGIAVTEAAGAQGLNPTPELPRHDDGKTIRPVVPTAQAAGSGFIVSPDGMIVTNDHVIAGAARITVTLNDGEKFAAQTVGTDDLTDLAIIKIKSPKPLQAAHWADSAGVQVGDWVLAAGNPFALGNSFTAGIISAEGRNIGDGPFDHFLQLDAPINPGNSGGPAYDMNGAVIGINTAIVSPSGGSVGIGFAIPSNTARPIVAALIAHGMVARGWLGVSVADLPAGANNGVAGAQITAVEADGPAWAAGLTADEIVLKVNGRPVSGAADLIRAIASMPPGTKVSLGISNNGHIFTVGVVVDRRPAQLGE